MTATTIIYEQPLNEIMRVCLRFEHLFTQTRRYIAANSNHEHRVALNYLLEILAVADRSDLRTKLSKTVNELIASFAQLQTLPDIDSDKLREVLEQLENIGAILHKNQGKLGQDLRNNEFLFTIGQRLSTPGGAAPFCLASANLWLNLPSETRKQDLQLWFDKLLEIEKVINLLLSLTRDSANFQPKTALNGFYQIALDTTVTYQLLRLQMPAEQQLYPEISVGRHRMAVHFFVLDVNGHVQQVRHDVDFKLACCKI